MSKIDIEQLKAKIAVQHDNDQKQLEVIFSEASRNGPGSVRHHGRKGIRHFLCGRGIQPSDEPDQGLGICFFNLDFHII